MRFSPALRAALLTALLLPGSAAADWLVTRDGSRLETRGPWELQGKLVIFRLADGTLSSLRLDIVDLEASESASEEARRGAAKSAPQQAPPPPTRAVLVLTDDDVAHAARADAPAAPTEEAVEEEAERLTVPSWEEVDDPTLDGLVFGGRLSNSSADVATAIRLTLRLYDREGALLATSEARLDAAYLPPGGSTDFRAEFPSVYDYAAVRFETESLGFKTAGGEEEPAPADEGGGG